jgi:hypothetical protein
VSVQVHLVPRGAVEEFLVETPAEADLHDLVDVPTRVLTSTPLAAATGGELSRALRALLGECAIGWQEADEVHRGAGLEGLEGTTIRLCDPAGGLLTLERPALPFTPAEFARARALLELEHRIAGRVAAQRAVILLTSGAELAIRQGVRADAAPVATMYRRCGPESRRRRSTPLERLLSRGTGTLSLPRTRRVTSSRRT